MSASIEYKFLSVRCERQLFERLEKVSLDSERTVSAQVRLALREHIERAEREPRDQPEA